MNKAKYIDITPKWEAIMRVMVQVLANPKASNESKSAIQKELIELAQWVDKVNEKNKQTA